MKIVVVLLSILVLMVFEKTIEPSSAMMYPETSSTSEIEEVPESIPEIVNTGGTRTMQTLAIHKSQSIPSSSNDNCWTRALKKIRNWAGNTKTRTPSKVKILFPSEERRPSKKDKKQYKPVTSEDSSTSAQT